MSNALQDVRYGLRVLRRSPGFTIVAVLTLALGIGATTAIASVVHTVLLAPLPFTESARLVRIVENIPSMFPGVPAAQRGPGYQEFLEWSRRTTTLESAAAVATLGARMVQTAEGTSRLWGAMTSTDAFALLGASALIGRPLGPSDSQHPDVVVLSAATWRRVFHADAGVLGTTIELRSSDPMFAGAPVLDGRVLTIVGVMPDAFEFPSSGPLDFYTPIVVDASKRPPAVTMIARLRPGVGLAAAAGEANSLGAAIRPPRPANAPALAGPRFEVQILKDQMVRPLRPALQLMLGAVVFVFLIVCANVANLLLARGTSRQREIAVRVALGASRARIARLVVTECALLAIAGGILGALAAAAGVELVKTMASLDAPGIFRLGFGTSILPRGDEVGVNLRLLAIALAVAALTTVLVGLLPALHISKAGLRNVEGSRSLHGITSRTGAGRSASRARSALVVSQLVMATVLLVGAGLLVRSFVRLSAVDRGYDPSNVLALQLVLPPDYSIARKADTIDALLARLRALPGVEAAGFTRAGLLIGEAVTTGTFVAPGGSLDEARRDPVRPLIRPVSSGYLTAAGIRFLDGRDFDATDQPTAEPVIVVSRSVARRYSGAERAVGSVIDWYSGNGTRTSLPIVGVVEDVRNTTPDREAAPEIFVEYRHLLALQDRWGDSVARKNELAIGFLSFAIRTRSSPLAATAAVARAVRAADPNAGIDALLPLSQLVASSVARQRFNAIVLTIFAGVAGLLAAIGIYAVLAYSVAQRTHEIGIRMALGARHRDVQTLIVGNGLLLTAAGIAIGLVAAAAAGRLLEGLLFGVTPLDPRTFVAVALFFSGAAAVACYVPARRATRVDPIVSLRAE